MVSWGGLGGLAPPGISVTRALPPGGVWGASPPRKLRYPCLASLGGRSPPIPVPCPPGGVWGAWPPQESPLITRALPPQRPCLAPVPCPQFFFVQIFSSEFFRRNFFVGIFSSEFFCRNFFVGIFFVRRRSVVRPSSVRLSVRPSVRPWSHL